LPRRASWFVVVAATLGCCLAAAAPAPKSQAKKKYDLRWRPEVGLRWAYEQSLDQQLTARAADQLGANLSQTHARKYHNQTVVESMEITEVRDGEATGKRVTFGPNCWSANQRDTKPAEKSRLAFSGKTVNFRIAPDGQLEQDFGVKPTGEAARILRNAVMAGPGIYPDHPVAVGERWRADDGLRPLLNLKSNDTVSAIVTLKGVREQDGRQVADLTLSAGVILDLWSLNSEVDFEGTIVADVKTGVMLKADLVGRSNASGMFDAGRGVPISVVGAGTMAFHRNGRMLPPASEAGKVAPAATQPLTSGRS
jgi:hypothetical protein